MGYNLQLYPFMMSALVLQTPLQTFNTWPRRTDGPFTFSTRLVSSNPCGRPITYFLEDVKVDGKSGNTSTTYKRFVYQKKKKCRRTDYAVAMAVERIVVLSRKMDPQYWTKEAKTESGGARREVEGNAARHTQQEQQKSEKNVGYLRQKIFPCC